MQLRPVGQVAPVLSQAKTQILVPLLREWQVGVNSLPLESFTLGQVLDLQFSAQYPLVEVDFSRRQMSPFLQKLVVPELLQI